MPKEMMKFLVDSSQQQRSMGRSTASFMTSFFIQTAILSALIIIPLLASDALPTPQGIMTFMAAAPPPPPPPPPPPAVKKRRRPTAPKPVLSSTPKFVAPVEIPDEIGDEFGVPGGVEGGVPGGVLGGIVGGLPDAPAIDTTQPVRVGGDIKPPRKIKDVNPTYPDIARQARVQGIVILEAIIDPSGNVTNVRVLRSIPLLNKSAIEAVQQWKYEPTRLNGVPVPIVMTVTVNFALQS